MEENLKNEIIRLIGLKQTTGYDVKSMVSIIQENIDPRFTCCVSCTAQIKFAQRLLERWYQSPDTDEQKVVNTEIVPEVKKGCQACKNKRANKK